MEGLVVVEGVYEGDDKKNCSNINITLFKKLFSHTFKTMAINNLKTLIPWSF
jgi:hypothetical protein